MRMSAWTAALALAAAALTGCGDDPEDISSAEYLLQHFHDAWANAKASLESSDPQLTTLFGLHVYLSQRVPRRLEKEYTGTDKAELLAKIKSLGEEYEKTVVEKLDLRHPTPQLKPGVGLDEVRKAFRELEPQYQQIRAMTVKDD